MLALTSDIQTPYHRWPAGPKLLALSLATVVLFATSSQLILLLWLAGVFVLYFAAGRTFASEGARMLRPLLPILALILAWHLVFGAAGEGLSVVMRLATAVALANLITLTTRLSAMMGLLLRLFAPLTRFGFPARAIALAMMLVIRFVPDMVRRTETLSIAWRARSNRRALWRLAFPLTISVLDDADHVAEALRARGGLEGQWNP